MRFELYIDEKGEHRWRLRSKANGRVIADSGEGYARAHDAKHGIHLVQTLAPTAEIVEIMKREEY